MLSLDHNYDQTGQKQITMVTWIIHAVISLHPKCLTDIDPCQCISYAALICVCFLRFFLLLFFFLFLLPHTITFIFKTAAAVYAATFATEN